MRRETLEWLKIKEQIAKQRTEYLKESEKNIVRMKKIESEGLKNMDDIVFYLEMNREELVKVNNGAVINNNQLLYIESNAIIRFIDNTLSLLRPENNRCGAETAEEYYGYQ